MGWKAIRDHYRIGHLVQVREGKIAIGSPYIPDIISVSPQGAMLKRYDQGAGWSVNEELARYQREFDADPAQLQRLAVAADEFTVLIPVYTYEGAEIIACFCEELGWPNVTHDGRMMYENTFSADRAEVVRWAIASAQAGIKAAAARIHEIGADLADAQLWHASKVAALEALLPPTEEPIDG